MRHTHAPTIIKPRDSVMTGRPVRDRAADVQSDQKIAVPPAALPT